MEPSEVVEAREDLEEEETRGGAWVCVPAPPIVTRLVSLVDL